MLCVWYVKTKQYLFLKKTATFCMSNLCHQLCVIWVADIVVWNLHASEISFWKLCILYITSLFMNIQQLNMTKTIYFFFHKISNIKYIFWIFFKKLVTNCLIVHLNDYFHLKLTNDIFEFLFRQTKYAYQINNSSSSKCPHQKLMTNFKWIFMIFHSYIRYQWAEHCRSGSARKLP